MIAVGTAVTVKPGTEKTEYEKTLCNKSGVVVGHGSHSSVNLMKFTDDEGGKRKHWYFEDEELEVLSNDRRPVSSK